MASKFILGTNVGSPDATFYVSGAIGKAGIAGTAVFGGDVVISGSMRSKQIHITHHSFNGGSSNQAYIPFAGLTENTNNQPKYQQTWVPPFNGRIVKMILRPVNNLDGDPLTGSIHVSIDGDIIANPPATEAIKQLGAAGVNVSQTFSFTGSNHFAAGDWVSVSFQGWVGGPGSNGACVTCVWELDAFI